jgi:hypothetical protein
LTTITVGATGCVVGPPPDNAKSGASVWFEYAFGSATAVVAFLYYSIHTLPWIYERCFSRHREQGLSHGAYSLVPAASEREAELPTLTAHVMVIDAASVEDGEQSEHQERCSYSDPSYDLQPTPAVSVLHSPGAASHTQGAKKS